MNRISLICCLTLLSCFPHVSAGQTTLNATVRDFRVTHPNMLTRSEFSFSVFEFDKGIVLPDLGDDGKPVFNSGDSPFKTVTNEADFSQWFNDVDGVNLSTEVELLQQENGTIGSRTVPFGPINGQLFDEGEAPDVYNMHFTMELNTEFTYRGGESMSLQSDDDAWVFIDSRLALDAGGAHDLNAGVESVRLDSLGLEVGENYPLDIFYAERASRGFFYITTDIELRNIPEPSGVVLALPAVTVLTCSRRSDQRRR